jgi:hypothetical protein
MLASGRSLDSGADKGDAAAVAGWTEGLPAGLDAYSGEEEAQQADRVAASTSKAEAEEDEQEQEQAARQADHKPRQSLDAAAETEAVTAAEEEGEAAAGEEGTAADDEDSWLEDEEPPQYLPLTTAPPEPQSAPAPAVLLMTEPADEGRAAAAEEGVHAELKGWVTDEAVSDTGAPLFADPPAEAELAVAAHEAAMAQRPATSDSMHVPLQEAWQEDPGYAQADRAVDDSGDASPAALQAAPMQDSNAGLAAEGAGVLPVGSGDTAAPGPENSPVAKLPCTESGDAPVAAVDCVPAAEAAEEVAAQQKAAAGIEAGMEAVTEASMEAGMEAVTEASMEAGAEAGTEAGIGAGTEVGTEAGMEAGIEAGMEAATEACTGAGIGAGTEAGIEADTEAGMEASMDTGMDPALVKAVEQQQEEEEAPVDGEQHAVEDAQQAQQEQQPAAEQQGKVVVPAAAAQEFAPAPDVKEQEDKEGRYEPQAEAEEVAADTAEDLSPDPSVEAVCAADTAGALLLPKALTAQEKQSLEEQEKEAQGQEQPLEEQEEEAQAAEQIQQNDPMARQQEEQEAQEQAVEQPIEGESSAEESSVPAVPLETQQREAAEVLALLRSSSCGDVAASPPAIDTLLEPAAAVVAAASPAISPSLTVCAAQLIQGDEMVATAAEGEAGQQQELPLLLQAPAADSSAPASPHEPLEAAMAVLASAPLVAPQQAAEEEHGMPPPQPQPQPQPADEEAAQLTGSPPVHPAPAADRMVEVELMRNSTAAEEEEQEEEEGEEGAVVEGAAVALVQGSLLESAAESLRLLLSPDAAPVTGAGPVTIDSKTPSEAAPPGSVSADKVPEGAETLAAAGPAEIETDGGSIAAGDEEEGGQGLSTPAEAAALGSASGSQLEAALQAPASPILVSGGGGVEAVQLQLEGSGPVEGTAGNATFAQLEPSAHTVDLAASKPAAAVVEQEAVAQEVEAEEEEAKEAVKQAGEPCSLEDAPAVVVEIEPVEEATSADESESGSDAGWPLGSEGSGDSDQQENASGLVTAVELFADLAGSPPALAALSPVPHPEASASDDSSAAHESSVVSEALPSASGSQQQQAAGQLVTAIDLCADLPANGPERAEAEQTVTAAEGNTTIQQLFLAAPGSDTAKD